ncbi:MAG TPA: M3 family peptidase, partial [Oceanospirillales bacterium]|nr:M3 family peptidase [Oceanospirillales bacterium]
MQSLKMISLISVLVVSSCSQVKSNKTLSKDLTKANPLLQQWQGAYGGTPAFDKMNIADVKPAFDYAMRQNLAEIDAIANNPKPATFENTIVAMEKSGKLLDRASVYYGILSGNLSSPEFRKIQAELEPKFSEFSSKIQGNTKLFKRIKTVYDNSLKNPLAADQQRVVQLVYEGFAMNGAELDSNTKQKYAAINKELSGLYNSFANNILHDEENYVTFFSQQQAGGLPESFLKSAAAAATAQGKDGMYAVVNTRSSMDPFLTYADNRNLRKKVWENYYSRGDNGDEYDNNANITKILQLRKAKVNLLGYDNYAQWRLQNRMAKIPENALNLLKEVWPAAIARVHEEVADMQKIADKNNITIKPWDYRYYAEKVRKAKYDLDSNKVKQYLELENLIQALHYVAGRLFNFKFTPLAQGEVPVYHPDVKVWKVTDNTTGKLIGLWYLDPYARKGKRSGAWANSYRSHTTFEGEKTVLSSNNANYVKPAAGSKTLISWDDAETLFHEFGHALHALSSNVRYPTLNSGVRDYTEFQSQLLERWLVTDEVINRYLKHYQTGKPIPKALVAKIKKAATFNQGFATTEYLASALMDMELHLADPSNLDPDKFERETLAKLHMPKELPMRHRTPQFGHVFSGEGYATAYYGYLWADVLTADAAEAFAEAPGGF